MLMHRGIDLTRTAKRNTCATPPNREELLTLSWEENHSLAVQKKNHFTNKPVRELIQKSFTSNMDQHLGEHISQVGGLPLLSYPGYYGSHIFPERMVSNNYVLLLQCRLSS